MGVAIITEIDICKEYPNDLQKLKSENRILIIRTEMLFELIYQSNALKLEIYE